MNALGVPFIARGLAVLDPWLVLFGLSVHTAGKNWFMDRMALLYDDVTAGPSMPATTTHHPGSGHKAGSRTPTAEHDVGAAARIISPGDRTTR